MTQQKGKKKPEGTNPPGRPPADIEGYFTKILPYLQYGCTLREACLQAQVPYTTVRDHVKEDVDLSDRIEQAQNLNIIKARENIIKQVQKWNPEMSKRYLERKRKVEFSTRIETTGPGGWPIQLMEPSAADIDNAIDE